MNETKLILIEGIPGSGKSTTAQFLARWLGRMGIPHKWWYEEENGHPVYVFDDAESMQRVVDDLSNGNYRRVVEQALRRWESFSAAVQSSDKVILIDSCLFGYLTWSLFPQNVPLEEIRHYVREVERIVSGCSPRLIYFYQQDVAAALRNICDRRGADTELHFIHAAADSPYGKARGLSGFDGLAAYWRDYRALTDSLFEHISFPKISIDNSTEQWPLYYRQMLDFLNIDGALDTEDLALPDESLQLYAGTYYAGIENMPLCTISVEKGALIADGLPQVWRKSQLIPVSRHEFEVSSLPFRVAFLANAVGEIEVMHLTGPALLDGTVDVRMSKVPASGMF